MKLRDEFTSLHDLVKYHEALREYGDIYPINTSTFAVTDYHLIRNIFRQSEDFKTFDFGDRIEKLLKIDPVKYNFEDIRVSMSDWLLFMDGPEHLAWKKKLMMRLYGLNLQSIIEEEWSIVSVALEDKTSFDLVSDLCEPLVTRIMCSIIGLDPSIFKSVRDIEKTFMKAMVPSMTIPVLQDIKSAHHEFQKIQDESWQDVTINQARLLDRLLKEVSPSERNRVFSQIEFLIAAGIESSVMLLSESMFRLVKDLRQYQKFLLDPESAKWMIDEITRMISPISVVTRRSTKRVNINNILIEEDTIILLFIACTSRDPRYFKYPDKIHKDNFKIPHIGFGHGRHHCIGTELAKLEMQLLLPAFINTFGSYEHIGTEKIKKSFYHPGIQAAIIKSSDSHIH